MNNNDQALSPNKQALLKIRELKRQLAEAEGFSGDPIAITSMACRFPRSSDTPEKFWQSLVEQHDLVSEIPEDRWDVDAFHDEDPEIPGKMYARKGVFLEQIDQMDPEFFGISPREATWVDPQQRLLMEVGWEALERAGWIPEAIGEHTGVFVGWMHNDYQNEASDSFLNLNPYIATGAAGSFLCGRLAYYLGLQGPSVAVDTACSSSLVALHLAIQSLQRGDCDRALVGGVNAICSPTTNILTCKLKALSPKGHSRAFDAAADGYLRGEGCGVVTLRPLADAEQEGDPILGIIRGSAVGHNGFSSGLTAPNPKAQEKVIRQALQRAGIAATDVSYLEAHGTGTELGDPIEVTAASAAYCENRSKENPLLIGSVKTNIGHLEAAAGMAGLIKVLLAMQHDSIPGQMNFEIPNPHIPWNELPIKVLTEPAAWPASESRIAGVSAFGMSGTNAHVVIEAPQPSSSAPNAVAPETVDEPSISDERFPSIISLSARHEEAVLELASAYANSLDSKDRTDLAHFALATNTRRSHFENRIAVVTGNKQDAITALHSIARGKVEVPAFGGQSRRPARVAWQFTGQGAQFAGMGQQLYSQHKTFRDAIDYCDDALGSIRDASLKSMLFEDSGINPAVHNTYWTQPAIFALQFGLAKLLESWNLKPDAVIGHSVGQYAAACVAGIMSWEDGLYLIAERGRLIGELPSGGRMLAVFAPVAAVLETISSESKVSLAAKNGTHQVISGEQTAVDRCQQSFDQQGIRTRALNTSHAFHSHMMDPVLESFSSFADQFAFQRGHLPLVCNMTGRVLPPDKKLDGKYWAEHIRQAVAFAPGIEAISDLNCDLILELGPKSVLTRMALANWPLPAHTLISCLRQDVEENQALAESIAQLYVQGVTPDFRSMYPARQRTCVKLPTYPFQRRRFWGPDKPRTAHAEHHTAHPLLGSRIELAGTSDEVRFESVINTDSPVWMPDHEVMNTVVLPGAALVEMAVEVVGSRTIENIVFEQPIRPAGRTAIQTVIKATDQTSSGRQKLETYAAPEGNKDWNRHFSCELVDEERVQPDRIERSAVQARLNASESPEGFYRQMNSMGLNYGPAFRCIRELHFSDQEVLSRLESVGDLRGYTIPPTILDAALHSMAVGLLRTNETDHLFLPVGMGRVQCYEPVDSGVWCLATWKQNEGATRTADLTLFSDSGNVLVKINELKVQQVSLSAMRQMSGAGAERLIYELQWQKARLPSSRIKPGNWILFAHSGCEPGLIANLAENLKRRDHTVNTITIHPGAEFTENPDSEFLIGADSAEDWSRLLDACADEQGQSQIAGIVWMLNGTESALNPKLDTGVRSIIHFVQAMLKRGWRSIPYGLQLTTKNAIAVDNADPVVIPQQSQYWGFGRVLGAEQPEMRCRLLDVDKLDPLNEQTCSLIIELACTETEDNQHLIRDGQLLVPRLVQSRLPRKGSYVACKEGAYLISGGLGKLGRQVAKWLADHGASQVVLVSRRAPNADSGTFIKSIEDAGCEVIVQSADMSHRKDVETLFARFGNELQPLAGVVHAAGVLDDGLLESQTSERFEKVLAPKVEAASLLDELTRNMELDLFVLYSSAASVLGSPGQSNYATANAWLDGLACQRRQLGLPALSINWGPWTEGMADNERILKQLALQGISPLSVDEAHAAMERLLANETIQATVMDVDWRRMRIGPGGEVPAMLGELASSRKSTRQADSAMVSRLKQLKPTAQRELLLTTIQNSLQGILSTPELPETDRPLIEMGLDSLMAVEFGTELQQMLGDQFNVGPTMLFDHPTIDGITDYVLELVAADFDSNQKSQDAQRVTTTGKQIDPRLVAVEDIAVIGMSCRFPGARNIDEFWQNLLNGVDSVCDIPQDRWDIGRFYSADRMPGKMNTRQGGFLDDIAEFDAAFFNISNQEACWIDPQHRMLLENSYQALEDAGISTSPLPDANVGVFMGIMGSDYAFLPSLDDKNIIEGFQGAGLSHSAGVGRISYLLGLEGPSVAVDTASSSSLVAVYQAMKSLQDGHCNMALAGGANAILAPVNSLLMSKAGFLAPDGRCKSFSKSADGFGRGEGCGVVVLKRLGDAQKDGDRVMAVIRGGAVVHNGFSGGITSPSGKAQTRMIDAAIRDAGIAPSQVQYLEAHGTGTEYGDPMELGAAVKIYGKGRSRQNPLLVGSVKANISHLEAAGGASGLIKTVLAIHHGVIPRQLHWDEPSPHIPWNRMSVKMVTETTKWPECERRTAGITALGLVGTNAHLVLSAPPETESPKSPATVPTLSSRLLTMSARTETALEEICTSYASYLQTHPQTDLDDFCYTVGAGRRHFEYRRALTCISVADAVRQLAGGVNQGRDPVQPFIQRESGNGNGDVSAEDWLKTGRKPVKVSPRLAWIFSASDQDPRRTLQQLIPEFKPVAEFITECDRRLESFSILEELASPRPDLSKTGTIQYLLDAACAKLWISWGIQPDATIGTGVGRYAAGAVAGCLCFLDAAELVHLQESLLSADVGESDWDAFETRADQFNFYPPNLPLVCSVSGEVVPIHQTPGGSYWREQAAAESAVESSIQSLTGLECPVGLFMGSRFTANSFMDQLANSGLKRIDSFSSIDESVSIMPALGKLYEMGCNPDFATVFEKSGRQPLSLPTYPFQKRRYWITEIAQFMDDEDAKAERVNA